MYQPFHRETTGESAATADFAFGYDTYGLKKYLNGGSIVDILDGFYVSDTANVEGTGPDVPELTLSGALTAAAELNVVLASAGVAANKSAARNGKSRFIILRYFPC